MEPNEYPKQRNKQNKQSVDRRRIGIKKYSYWTLSTKKVPVAKLLAQGDSLIRWPRLF
jgi:hypothetical protein